METLNSQLEDCEEPPSESFLGHLHLTTLTFIISTWKFIFNEITHFCWLSVCVWEGKLLFQFSDFHGISYLFLKGWCELLSSTKRSTNCFQNYFLLFISLPPRQENSTCLFPLSCSFLRMHDLFISLSDFCNDKNLLSSFETWSKNVLIQSKA